MSVPKFKRKPSGLDFVDNAFELQKEIINLASKLSARWARIYSEPIVKLSTLQADFVNMASSIKIQTVEDYITRRWFIIISRTMLSSLEKRVMDMVRILYMNPSKCFSRKNGKNLTKSEATMYLDNKLEDLGVNYQRQYDLLKGVLEADKKKYEKIKRTDITDKEIIEMLISKGINCFINL